MVLESATKYNNKDVAQLFFNLCLDRQYSVCAQVHILNIISSFVHMYKCTECANYVQSFANIMFACPCGHNTRFIGVIKFRTHGFVNAHSNNVLHVLYLYYE